VTFFKLGCICFGGGYAIIPLLQIEAVERRKWLTKEELLDIMAISQTFPGAIFVNSSTMIGYKVCGFKGSAVATAASLIPVFTLILVITTFFWNYTENAYVKKVFRNSLKCYSLILHSITKMWKSSSGILSIYCWCSGISALLLFKLMPVCCNFRSSGGRLIIICGRFPILKKGGRNNDETTGTCYFLL
jgi:chromate transporter